MESHYPVSVTPLDDYRLSLIFDNDEKRIFDVRPYLEDRYYAPLKNPAVFRSVKINPVTIEWMNEIDICPDELYYNSVLCENGCQANLAPGTISYCLKRKTCSD